MCVYLSCYSCVQLFATLWMVSFHAPLSVGFPRQECWSRLPCPPPKNLPDPGIEPESPTVQADSLPSEPLSPHFWTSLQPSPSHPSRSSQSIKLNSLLSPAVAYHLGLRIKKKKTCEAWGWHGGNFDYSIDRVECIPHFSRISPSSNGHIHTSATMNRFRARAGTHVNQLESHASRTRIIHSFQGQHFPPPSGTLPASHHL